MSPPDRWWRNPAGPTCVTVDGGPTNSAISCDNITTARTDTIGLLFDDYAAEFSRAISDVFERIPQ